MIGNSLSPLVKKITEDTKATHVFLPSTSFGKDLMPRVAALLDVAPISDIIAVKDASTFQRPMYAGNILATVQSDDAVKLLTVRATAFDRAKESGGSAEVSDVSSDDAKNLVQFKSDELKQSDRPDLGTARVVVSGGRGMKSGENFKLLEELADQMGGAGNEQNASD